MTPLTNISSLADGAVRDVLDGVLQQLRTTGVTRVVVDFENVAYFGSSMLEALLVIWSPLRSAGGRMVLCGLSDVGREIITLARFDTLWPLYGTLAEALASFDGETPTSEPA